MEFPSSPPMVPPPPASGALLRLSFLEKKSTVSSFSSPLRSSTVSVFSAVGVAAAVGAEVRVVVDGGLRFG